MTDETSAPRPLRTDERLGRVAWPILRRIESPTIPAGGCVILCAGFEDRAVEVWRRICRSGNAKFQTGLITYLPSYQQNRTSEFHEIARDTGVSITEISYDRRNPAGIGKHIAEFVCGFDHVFIDVSGMSRLLIVQTLVALLSTGCRPITLMYSEADRYPPSREQFDQDQRNSTDTSPLSYLSSGIFEIAITPELSSIAMLGENIRLVAFPSFDRSHLVNLIQELQPTYTDLISGIPPAEANAWRTEAVRELNRPVLDSLPRNTNHCACTLDYTKTLRILLDIYKERSMFDKIVVAPTGSKMQAVAVALFRAALSDVQIVYPTPHTFTAPDEYTVGVRRMYALDLPVEQIAACRPQRDESGEPEHSTA